MVAQVEISRNCPFCTGVLSGETATSVEVRSPRWGGSKPSLMVVSRDNPLAYAATRRASGTCMSSTDEGAVRRAFETMAHIKAKKDGLDIYSPRSNAWRKLHGASDQRTARSQDAAQLTKVDDTAVSEEHDSQTRERAKLSHATLAQAVRAVGRSGSVCRCATRLLDWSVPLPAAGSRDVGQTRPMR